MIKIKTNLKQIDIYFFWIIISVFLNSLLDTNNLFFGCVFVINTLLIIRKRDIIFKYKYQGFFIIILSFIYFLKFSNVTIFRYTAYIFYLYSYIIIFDYVIRQDNKRICDVFEKLGVVNAIISISEVIFGTNVFLDMLGVKYSSLNSGGGYRACGITVHPIINASFALLIFFMLLVKDKMNRYSIINSIVQLITIALTKTRSAYIAVIIIAIITLIKVLVQKRIKINKKVVRIIIFCVLLLIILMVCVPSVRRLIYFSFIGRIIELFSTGSGSYFQRIGSINFIINNIKENILDIKSWFGHGYGNLISYLYSNKIFFVQSGFYVIDNQYISMIYDIGIINFLIVLVLIMRNYIMNNKIDDKYKNILISLLIMFFFYEFIDKSLNLIMLGFVFALLEYNKNSIEK